MLFMKFGIVVREYWCQLGLMFSSMVIVFSILFVFFSVMEIGCSKVLMEWVEKIVSYFVV